MRPLNKVFDALLFSLWRFLIGLYWKRTILARYIQNYALNLFCNGINVQNDDRNVEMLIHIVKYLAVLL